jgi:hypothetical protein
MVLAWIDRRAPRGRSFPFPSFPVKARNGFIAGWSSPVARQAHNLKVASSNLAPATNFNAAKQQVKAALSERLFFDANSPRIANASRLAARRGSITTAPSGSVRAYGDWRERYS